MGEKVKYNMSWSVDEFKGVERFDNQDELTERIAVIIMKYSTDGEIKISVLEY